MSRHIVSQDGCCSKRALAEMLFFAGFLGGDTLYTGERNVDLMGVSTGVICCRHTPVGNSVDEMRFGVTNRIVCNGCDRFLFTRWSDRLDFGRILK